MPRALKLQPTFNPFELVLLGILDHWLLEVLSPQLLCTWSHQILERADITQLPLVKLIESPFDTCGNGRRGLFLKKRF